MATRATAADVIGIMDTSYDETTVLPFLTSANVVVTTHLGSSGLSDEILLEIERWLAAHFVSLADPSIIDKNTAGLQKSFERGVMGKNLNATRYGQQVQFMDPTGILAALAREQRSTFLFRAGSPDSTSCASEGECWL